MVAPFLHLRGTILDRYWAKIGENWRKCDVKDMDTGSIKDEDVWEYVKYEEEQASDYKLIDP